MTKIVGVSLPIEDADVNLSGIQDTEEGYLEAVALTVRTGVQMYHSSELEMKDENRMIAVYRSEAEVFHKDSVASFARKPVTLNHPPMMVDKDNWAAYSVGDTDSEIIRDGDSLRVPMTIRHSKAVKAVKDGIRELSAGYMCDIEFQDGVAPDGTPYEAVQTNIRANHVAIVAKGRAGARHRLGDAAVRWGAAPITVSDKEETQMTHALKTVVLGDKAIQIADADVAEFNAWKAGQAKALTDAKATHDKEMAAKDAELAKAKADLEEEKKKVPTGDAIDKLVAARATLLDQAKAISPKLTFDGLSDADVRKAVVVDKRGEAVKDKSAEYIEASFDILVADAQKTDPVRKALADKASVETNDKQGDHNEAYRQSINDAWKTPVKQEA